MLDDAQKMALLRHLTDLFSCTLHKGQDPQEWQTVRAHFESGDYAKGATLSLQVVAYHGVTGKRLNVMPIQVATDAEVREAMRRVLVERDPFTN